MVKNTISEERDSRKNVAMQ